MRTGMEGIDDGCLEIVSVMVIYICNLEVSLGYCNECILDS